MLERWALHFTEPLRHTRTATFLCKSLYALILLRIMLSWGTFTELAQVYVLSAPRSVFARIVFSPGLWAAQHMSLFLAGYIVLLALALWLRPNYVTATLIAWWWLNLYRLFFPVSNGADEVMAVLLVLTIPLGAYPVLQRPKAAMLQRAAYHAAYLFIQLLVCAIYFVSGVDKLTSTAWRSGEALVRVRGLTYAFNDAFAAWMPAGGPGLVALAWLTIGFELLFPLLVWFRVTRKWILIAGVVFHLIIGAMLTLPAFAAVMIVSYSIFLTFEQSDDDKL